MGNIYSLNSTQFRSIWISDTHLGSKECRADILLDFLNSTSSENLFLVGDIIDLWSMKRTMFWPQLHNDVVWALLKKSKTSNIVYIPGNHDSQFRDHDGIEFGKLKFYNQYVHTTANNIKLLILHGDLFDSVIRQRKIVELFGYYGYDFLLYFNRAFNYIRNLFGYPYWSLATYLKKRVKNAMKHVANFEHAAIKEANKHHLDGIICGHIHHAALKQIDGLTYCNTGDWVENCTALVEHHDGTLELLNWTDNYINNNLVKPKNNVAVKNVVINSHNKNSVILS